LYHQSEATVRRHHTDGGGDSDHVFALLALLGFQFAAHPGFEAPPALQLRQAVSLSGARTVDRRPHNVALIRAHWSEILRIATSIRTGTVTASFAVASPPRGIRAIPAS
jgi:TnpA family transposase